MPKHNVKASRSPIFDMTSWFFVQKFLDLIWWAFLQKQCKNGDFESKKIWKIQKIHFFSKCVRVDYMIIESFQSVLGHPKYVFEALWSLWDSSVNFCKSRNFGSKSRFLLYSAVEPLKVARNVLFSKINLFFKSSSYNLPFRVRNAKAECKSIRRCRRSCFYSWK